MLTLNVVDCFKLMSVDWLSESSDRSGSFHIRRRYCWMFSLNNFTNIPCHALVFAY